MTSTQCAALPPQPPINQRIFDANGDLTPLWRIYLTSLDKVILRQLLVGPLINAANDTAAATAGVPISGLYRTGNAVQIRLT